MAKKKEKRSVWPWVIGVTGFVLIVAIWLWFVFCFNSAFALHGIDGATAFEALFSGLAFIGVLIAIYLQSVELRRQSDEMRDNYLANKEQAENLMATTFLTAMTTFIEKQDPVPEAGTLDAYEVKRMLLNVMLNLEPKLVAFLDERRRVIRVCVSLINLVGELLDTIESDGLDNKQISSAINTIYHKTTDDEARSVIELITLLALVEDYCTEEVVNPELITKLKEWHTQAYELIKLYATKAKPRGGLPIPGP